MISTELKIEISENNSRALKGFILLLLAVLFWGTSAPIGKHLIVTRFDTLVLAQTRTSLTFVLLIIIFLIRDRSFLKVEMSDLWRFAFLGVVGISITNYTYYFTMKEASVATAIIVQYTAPVWVFIYSVYIKKEEKFDAITIFSLLLSLFGCFIAVTSGSTLALNLKGWAILTGPISAFTFAYQIVATKHLLKRYSIWTVLIYIFGFSTLFWLFINPPWVIISKNYTAGDWGWLWLFAIISILIPQTAFASGLRLLRASTAGIISILEPIIAILMAFLILGELLTIIQIFGAVLVIIAIGLLQSHPLITRKYNESK